MTNKEALIAVLQVSLPDSSIDLALANAAIEGADTYSSARKNEVELCAIPLLQGLLSQPDVSEGDYSIKFDRKAVERRLLYLAKAHGLTDIVESLEGKKPTVTGRSVW